MIDVALSVALRSTALLVALFGLASLFRRSPAGLRHAVWSFGFVALLALPLLTAASPWRLSILPAFSIPAVPISSPVVRPSADLTAAAIARGQRDARANRVDRADRPAQDERAATLSRSATASSLAPRSDVDERRAVSMAQIAAALWLVGGLFVLGRLVRGAASIGRMARSARPVKSAEWRDLTRWAALRLGLRTRVGLVESGAVSLPMTIGLWRPTVILPRLSRHWPRARRRAVLLHELAHVQRRDVLTHWLAWGVCAVYWFHPLVWIAARRLRHECERACDDAVLAAGTRPSDYAGHLLDIVRAAGRERAPVPAVPFAQRSSFEGRLLAILEPGIARGRVGLRRAGVALAVVGLGTLFLALATPASDSIDAVAAPVQPTPAVRSAGAGSGLEAAPADFDPDVVADPPAELGPEPSDARPRVVTATGIEIVIEDEIEIVTDEGAGIAIDTTDMAAVLAALAVALGDTEVAVRQAAAQTLGSLEDPRAVAALSKALLEDSDAGVRQAAAEALGEIEDPAAVPALITALQRDGDAEVRANAAWALGEIEDPAATDALIDALDDADSHVREHAIQALAELENPAAAPGLLRMLRDSDAEIREEAAWALGELDLTVAPPELIEAVSDTDPEVRMAVIHALADIEDPATVDVFLDLLRDADPEIRETALWALDDMADGVSTDVLLELLQDEDPDVREAAAHALADHDD